MDLKGSLVNTNLKLYPTKKLLDFIKSIPNDVNVPENLALFTNSKISKTETTVKDISLHLTQNEIDFLHGINKEAEKSYLPTKETKDSSFNGKQKSSKDSESNQNNSCPKKDNKEKESVPSDDNKNTKPFLLTSDLDWLYTYLKEKRNQGDKYLPYLNELLEGTSIELPENKIIRRNPVLEERCKKLRSQQEAREYRSMTKGVDNVRMKFPEDSISYQLKQLNRQLIAVGQFLISIFAGFLFGFKGVDLMIGGLDFGFRLLLGVMCALVIALAEIYFLAKKLNEELNIPEPVQLGGPLKFADDMNVRKEHQE